MADTASEIATKYPQFVSLFNSDPEIRWVLSKAVDPTIPFDSGRFQSELMQTNWWKNTATTQRNWLLLSTTDPATAEAQVQQKIGELRGIAGNAGLNLSDNELRWEATAAIQNNWNDQQVHSNLLAVSGLHGTTPKQRATGGGTMAENAQQIRGLASQYLLPISDTLVGNWADQMFRGEATLDGIKGGLAAQAIHAWGAANPAMAAHIQQGGTAREFIDPQIQAVASTLEMNPDQVDPVNPRWSPILNYTDKAGQLRMMTVPEAQVWARSQDEFQHTNQGRQAASDMVTSLAQKMGAIR